MTYLIIFLFKDDCVKQMSKPVPLKMNVPDKLYELHIAESLQLPLNLCRLFHLSFGTRMKYTEIAGLLFHYLHEKKLIVKQGEISLVNLNPELKECFFLTINSISMIELGKCLAHQFDPSI